MDTLISVLPEQLKSRLTEAEVEQFATRLYSRLHSDGLFGSINFDSGKENKETTVRSRKCFFKLLTTSDDIR